MATSHDEGGVTEGCEPCDVVANGSAEPEGGEQQRQQNGTTQLRDVCIAEGQQQQEQQQQQHLVGSIGCMPVKQAGPCLNGAESLGSNAADMV
eukprot:10889460-Prorocentrum_lima.AAC.1